MEGRTDLKAMWLEVRAMAERGGLLVFDPRISGEPGGKAFGCMDGLLEAVRSAGGTLPLRALLDRNVSTYAKNIITRPVAPGDPATPQLRGVAAALAVLRAWGAAFDSTLNLSEGIMTGKVWPPGHGPQPLLVANEEEAALVRDHPVHNPEGAPVIIDGELVAEATVGVALPRVSVEFLVRYALGKAPTPEPTSLAAGLEKARGEVAIPLLHGDPSLISFFLATRKAMALRWGGLGGRRAVIEYLLWAASSMPYSAVATVAAVRFLSGQGLFASGWQSADYGRVQRTAFNAAWDLRLVCEWVRQASAGPAGATILVSADKGLKRLAMASAVTLDLTAEREPQLVDHLLRQLPTRLRRDREVRDAARLAVGAGKNGGDGKDSLWEAEAEIGAELRRLCRGRDR